MNRFGTHDNLMEPATFPAPLEKEEPFEERKLLEMVNEYRSKFKRKSELLLAATAIMVEAEYLTEELDPLKEKIDKLMVKEKR